MDIYAEEVMDHYENPRNQGSIEDLSGDSGQVLSGRDSNSSCGDMVQFYLNVKTGKISDVKWEGIGCAITIASASKLSEYLQGRTLKEIRKMGEEELVKKGIGFEVGPGRMKCLTLPARVMIQLLS